MILLAGVGYSHLRDMSFGPLLVERLRRETWPDDVEIQDLSYGPVAVVQWLQDEPGRFERAIIIGAVERGRQPGTLTRYRWLAPELSSAEIQDRVSEAVTGVIGLENLLIIADYFGALPSNTTVIEAEPLDLEWGTEPSALIERRLGDLLQELREEFGSTGTTAGRAGTVAAAQRGARA
ncbi:MAG: hydrogenase maturation protease [Chloroflexota bacterium]|nr:hydrogenase maturation protease [Chloroflexota bacterium]